MTIPASAEPYDDLTYSKVDEDEDGVYDYIIIKGCDKSAVSVDIPAEIKGLPVTSIASEAFMDCTSLTSITIPDSVTSIGGYAFSWCESLTSITIPDSVTSIGEHAFYVCLSLTNINIPDGVTFIGQDAFFNTPFLNNQTSEVKYAGKWVIDCDQDIETAEIKYGTKGIAGSAFFPCTSLESINIPDSVTYIGEDAFGYASFESITIPDSVTSIEKRAFALCPDLKSITILNPDCEIYDASDTIGNNYGSGNNIYFNGTIYGYTNSTAQAYAKKYERNFVSLDDKPENPTDPTEKPTEPVTTTAPVETKPTETGVKPDPTEPSEGDYYLGNVDGNTAINIFDAVIVAQYTVGKHPLTPEQLKAADVDHNDTVNIFDAVIIAKYTVGTPFPD